MRLLIIEDNDDFQKYLRMRLEEKCFAVDTADSGEHGLVLAEKHTYDLILLDYTLPGKDGYQVCSELRTQGKHMPIIILSGTAAIPHKVTGFNLGIDDYVVKPFFFEELIARISAVLRRPKTQADTLLKVADLSVNTIKQKVVRGKNEIQLTRKEFTLLEYLLRNTGKVLSRGDIMDHVWNTELGLLSRTIETHIMNLRKKIDLPRKCKLIHSIPGRGYKIDVLK